MSSRPVTTSTRARGIGSRFARAALVAGLFLFALSALAPTCAVTSAMAHPAGSPVPDDPILAATHLAHDDPACCDEMRSAAYCLGLEAVAQERPGAWPSFGALTSPRASYSAPARSSAGGFAAGLPPGFAPVPAYLRTLRLRV